MKKVFYLIFFLVLNIYAYCEVDCGTPVECYVKAIAILKSDREEMIRKIDSMQQKLDDTYKKYEELLSQTKLECENKYHNSLTFTKDVNANLNGKIEQVVNSIPHEMQCYSATLGGRISPCKNGYRPVSCSCGSGSGTWDIDHNGRYCKCQSGEWATSICCKIA